MPSNYQVNMDKYGETDMHGKGPSGNSGCHCSTAVGFLMLLIAIAIAVGVGIIVHFAGGDREVTCNYNVADKTAEETKLACVGFVSQGNGQQICAACPKDDVTTATTRTRTTPQDTLNTTTTTTMTTTTQSITTETPAPSLLLPTSIIPISYQIFMRPDFYSSNQSDWSISGTLTVHVTCLETTSVITMHVLELGIMENSIMVREENGADNLYKSHILDVQRQFIHIHTTTDLLAGRNYSIEFTNFTPKFRYDQTGIFIASYERTGQTVYLATTQMAMAEARKVFPCFDEPAMKATFDVRVARKAHMVALSNMPVKTSQQSVDDWVLDTFETTPVMSTYLLAFSVSDYGYTDVTSANGVQVRVWSRKEAINQTTYAVDTGSRILTYFEDYFGSPFPMPKQDMIAINDFQFGAMENWGLILFREDTVLYDVTKTTPIDQFNLVTMVSHEISHNWFGNLVSPEWWDDLWLNEGFATFMAQHGVHVVEPDWHVLDYFVYYVTRSALISDGRVTSHPLYIPGQTDHQVIMANFDTISYQKGACVLRMLEFLLGKDTFQRGLQRYLQDNEFGNVGHEDLWQAFGKQAEEEGKSHIKVKDVMNTWVRQMNYPLVTVQHEEQGKIRLSQKRYLENPTSEDPMAFSSEYGYRWEIPFSYTTSTDGRFDQTEADIVMMHMNDSAVVIESDKIPAPSSDSWIIGNIQYSGFYRVNYDSRNWDAIINQLNANHTVIHPANRIQILIDTWALAKSGEVKLDTALRVTEYMARERELGPWDAFVANNRELMHLLFKYPVYGPYKNFMKDTFGPPYDEYTMDNSGANFVEASTRRLVVGSACHFEYEPCINEAKQLFAQWMTNPDTSPINVAIASSVYCTAIRHGGEAEWDFLFGKYQTENLRSEKHALLGALTCTQEQWILAKMMNMALEGIDIIPADFPRTFFYLSYNSVAESAIWAFYRKHFDKIYKKNGSYWSLVTLQWMTWNFNTDVQIDEMERFGEEAEVTSHPFFQSAVETARNNRNWIEKNMETMEDWLSEKGY